MREVAELAGVTSTEVRFYAARHSFIKCEVCSAAKCIVGVIESEEFGRLESYLTAPTSPLLEDILR